MVRMGGQRKRAFKAEDQVDQGGKAAKRHKKGRPAIRRLCKGMCYGPPSLQAADMEADEEFTPQPQQQQPQDSRPQPEQPPAADKPANQPRLSGQAAVQLYLQRLRFQEPTPLQSRWAGSAHRRLVLINSTRMRRADAVQAVASAAGRQECHGHSAEGQRPKHGCAAARAGQATCSCPGEASRGSDDCACAQQVCMQLL